MHPKQLSAGSAGAIRKQNRYSPLVEALDHYTSSGWTVHVLPWVVGVRCIINPHHIYGIICPSKIPDKCRKFAIKLTHLARLASVKALYFLHQVRFSDLYGRGKAWRKQITTATPVTLKPPNTRSCRPSYPNSYRESLPMSHLSQPLTPPVTTENPSQPTCSVHTGNMLNQYDLAR